MARNWRFRKGITAFLLIFEGQTWCCLHFLMSSAIMEWWWCCVRNMIHLDFHMASCENSLDATSMSYDVQPHKIPSYMFPILSVFTWRWNMLAVINILTLSCHWYWAIYEDLHSAFSPYLKEAIKDAELMVLLLMIDHDMSVSLDFDFWSKKTWCREASNFESKVNLRLLLCLPNAQR